MPKFLIPAVITSKIDVEVEAATVGEAVSAFCEGKWSYDPQQTEDEFSMGGLPVEVDDVDMTPSDSPLLQDLIDHGRPQAGATLGAAVAGVL